ncbi:MAG: helix-turn-helix domain-containing protein, partial [bacterium]
MNQDPLEIKNSKLEIGAKSDHRWLSMSEAALLVPYSAEYLSLLARKNKLASKKIGNTWYTTRTALEQYMQKQMIRTQVQNGHYHGVAPLTSQVKEAEQKIELPDQIALRQIRSYRNDANEFINRSGVSIETALDTVTRSEPKIEKKSLSVSEHVNEMRKFSPVAQFEEVFERVLDKKFSGKKGTRLVRTQYSYRNIFTSKILVVAMILLIVSFTIFPIPIVFSFFEKSFTALKEVVNDSNTVMGFRPGTHANEILLLDKEGNVSIMGHVETEGQLRSYIADGTAPIVVDSKTTVENLSADTVDGVSSEEFTLAFVTANGNITTEDVILEGNVEVGKILKVRGATKLLSALDVGGDLEVFGNAEFAKVLRVVGPAYFESVLTAQSNMIVAGDMETKGNLSVRKNVEIRGGLEVGSAVIAKSGSFDSVGVAGNFSAGGKITLGNEKDEIIIKSKNVTIDVSGNANFDGGVGASSLNATSLLATNSTTTNATSTSIYAVNAVFDNLTSDGVINLTNLSFTDATGTNATTTNFYSNTISGLIGFITSIVADDISVGALTATNSTSTNATSTNIYSEKANFDNLTAGTIDFTNLSFDLATGTSATTTNFFS